MIHWRAVEAMPPGMNFSFRLCGEKTSGSGSVCSTGCEGGMMKCGRAAVCGCWAFGLPIDGLLFPKTNRRGVVCSKAERRGRLGEDG